MRFRSLALFALVAGFVVLAGDLPSIGAQDKANKKNKKALPPAPTPEKPAPADPNAPPAAKPLVSTNATPATKDAAALARVIDSEIARKLAAAKLTASAPCSDEEFLRRVYLDITGVIPSAESAKAFLDDTSADKRSKLIDELLNDPHFGRRMADIWTAKLFPKDSNNRFVLKEPLYKWFEDQFNKNPGWDKLVSSLVTATGTVADNPATTYFLANRSVDKLTDTTTQHFLGIQLQCAQCHNHPFTSWKQTEYWGVAAFYSKVKPDNPKNANKGGDNTTIGVNEGNGRTGSGRRCGRSSSIRAVRVALRDCTQLSRKPSYASREANAREPRSRSRWSMEFFSRPFADSTSPFSCALPGKLREARRP